MPRVKISVTRLRAYLHLIEGKSQSEVARTLHLDPSTLSYHARELQKGGYLVRLETNPASYEKGKRGPLLDAIALYNSGAIDASGVVAESIDSYRVVVTKVHHLLLRAEVVAADDIVIVLEKHQKGWIWHKPVFHKSRTYRGAVVRYYGNFGFEGRRISIEYEMGKERKAFYVHPPALELTNGQIGQWKAIIFEECRRILNSISKTTRWRFGRIEFRDWKPHFAYETRALRGITDKVDVIRSDGTIWTSNSGDTPELETNEPLLAIAILEMPRKTVQLDARVKECEKRIRELIKALESAESNLGKEEGENHPGLSDDGKR